MYFHYMQSVKFIKKIVVPTSDARPVNQLFGASGRFFHSGSQLCNVSNNCELDTTHTNTQEFELLELEYSYSGGKTLEIALEHFYMYAEKMGLDLC